MLLRSSIALLALVSMNTIAHAQGAPDPEAGAAAEPSPDPAAATEPAPAPAAVAPAPGPSAKRGGASLRNGFSLSVGQEFGETNAGQSFSGQLYGFDWRIGAKISDAIAVYVHSHLSFGTVGPDQGSGGGVTGNLAAALVGEYTLPMRLFVGAGAGYGVLNNPNGPLVEARVGYYPFKTTSEGKARRLNVALDGRWYMVGDPYGTVTQISISLGYDRF